MNHRLVCSRVCVFVPADPRFFVFIYLLVFHYECTTNAHVCLFFFFSLHV